MELEARGAGKEGSWRGGKRRTGGEERGVEGEGSWKGWELDEKRDFNNREGS